MLRGNAPNRYLIIFCFLHKKRLAVLPELHVEIYWFSVDFHVHLKAKG